MKILFLLFFATFLSKINKAQQYSDSIKVTIESNYGYMPKPFVFNKICELNLNYKPFYNALEFNKDVIYFNPIENFKKKSRVNLFVNFVRFYDTDKWSFNLPDSNAFLVNVATKATQNINWNQILQPFWLKKFEVTNAEYKEFTNEIGNDLLRKELSKVDKKYLDQNCPINLTPKELDSLVPELFLPINNRIFGMIERNTEKYFYTYQDESNIEKLVKIYPDTLVWLKTNKIGNNNDYLLTRNYYRHPSFKEYPVVGINWFQAKAYCNWLTQKIQKQYGDIIPGYKLVVDLPNEYEREYAITNFEKNNHDNFWLMDLIINSESKFDETQNLQTLLYNNINNSYQLGNYFTHAANVEKIINGKYFKKFSLQEQMLLKNSIDKNGIAGLNNNVSEWMNESFEPNCKSQFEQRSKIIESIQFGNLTQLNETQITDFYEQNIKILPKELMIYKKNSKDWAKAERWNGNLFYHLNEQRIDSFKNIEKVAFQFNRSNIKKPKEKIIIDLKDTVGYKNDNAIERLTIKNGLDTHPYSNIETEIIEAIYEYKNEIPLIKNIEDFYFKRQDNEGKLVRGCNWMDSRYNFSFSKNEVINANGLDAKAFVNPNKASSTIGFRYLIRLVKMN